MITTHHLRKLAGEGDADAQFRYGYRLAFGRRHARSAWSGAARWWTSAAYQGHSRAQFYLATCYDFGRGVLRDLAKAMGLYRSAAKHGHAEAQYNLALGFRDGAGVRKDSRAAANWFRSAAKNGDAEGQNELGYCLHEGRGVRRNQKQAVVWYRRAAQQGLSRAQFNLGLCYLEGTGVTKNRRVAAVWLRRAAVEDHKQAALVVLREWPSNKVTGANAGGRRRLPMRTLRVARIAQFAR